MCTQIKKDKSLKVTLINTSETVGGAAVACNRLLKAIRKQGKNAQLLVRDKKSNEPFVKSTTNSWFKEKLNFYRFVYERLSFLPYERSKQIRFAFSLANSGEDISKNTLVKEADVLHLHWINQGFLSLKSLERLFISDKPIIWTLHDMWSFTGGCHYAGDCSEYKNNCGNCPFLKNPKAKDLSYRILKKKEKLFEKAKNLTFVTCSNWLAEKVKESYLLKNFNIKSIPNSIDTNLFSPQKREIARRKRKINSDKRIILFGAANIFDTRKGWKYLTQSLDVMYNKHPEINDKVELMIFGKAQEEINLPYKVHNLSYLNNPEEIAEVYSLADVFVLPSLEDNLPNTVMESLACGTPVVAFDIGGIPEMVKHNKTGFLATKKNSEELAEGIYQTLFKQNKTEIRTSCRQKVLNSYSENTISNLYWDLYESLI